MRPSALLCTALTLLALTTGCSTGFNPALSGPATSTSALGPIQGNIHGGQQPVSGSHVYVYAAATSAYGAASSSLLNAFSTGSFPTAKDASNNYYVTSDANGNFALTGEYTCTSGQNLYLYASGGNPGAGANSAIGLMAVLGTCPSGGAASLATLVPVITVNEVSTVAAAYALAGFATDATHIGTSAYAFANVTNLISIPTAAALATTPAGNGAVPQAEINTLANILAACVNTTGPSAAGCSTLFGAATSDGTFAGTRPTETATAAINLAHHPGTAANTALVSNQTPNSPFFPALPSSTAPNDFTLALTFSGKGIAGPSAGTLYGLAIDASQNVWVADGGYVAELLNSGAPATGSPFAGTFNASAVAVSPYGYIAVTDSFDTALNDPAYTIFNADGTVSQAATAIPFFSHALLQGTQNISISNVQNQAGSQFTIIGYSDGTYNTALYPEVGTNPYSVANDSSGYVWITSGNNVYVTSSSKLHPSYSTFTGLSGARGIACTNSGVWVTNFTGNSVSSLSFVGSLSSSGYTSTPVTTTYTGGGLNGPQMVAIDGAGTAWVANLTGSSVSAFSSTGIPLSPSTGYLAGLSSPYSIAIDAQGNVWLSNSGNSTVTEMIGLAKPATTPISSMYPLN